MEKIAVIGLGNIANRHRRNLKILYPNAKIIVMSASGRVPAEEIADSDIVVATIEEILAAEVDFAIVASPATFHALHTVPLLQANVPVLIEKPITASDEDANAIISNLIKQDTPAAVAYCLRYLPSMQIVQTLLEDQAIGQLYNAHIEIGQYLPDWRPSKDYRTSVSANEHLGGGALLELSHELDYVEKLLGPLTLEHAILRSTQELQLNVEDIADLILRTEDHAVVQIHLDFLQKKAYRKCRFIGSLGAIEWDLIKNEVQLIAAEQTQVVYSEPDWDKNQMYLAMVQDFVAQIQQTENNCVTVSEAAQTVKLINQIKQYKYV